MELAIASTTPRADTPGPTTIRPQVLYVDNATVACRLLEHLFESRDFDFSWSTDPDDALGQLKRDQYDVIIAAFQGFGMSPLEFLKTAREVHPEALRVQASANPSATDVVQSINEAGLARYITKKWCVDDVEKAIVELVDEVRPQLERERLARRCVELERETSRLRGRIERLASMHAERTLEGLMAVLAFRQPDAKLHSYRAATYASFLGRQHGLNAIHVRALTRGALLHDLGKIGISDQILSKPGTLTEAEWDEMRWHPALGHGLLNEFDFLDDARAIVLQHHERWDGCGYPNGICGDTIELGARICAVADSLDAMTSHRPYRRALPFRDAWEEIQRCAGSQFDPGIVDTFVGIGRDVWSDMVTGQRIEQLPRPW